jgi:hypothetical protein
MCLLAGITVGLDRPTSLGGCRRWLPEWLPGLTAPAPPELRKCNPAATVASARHKARHPRARPEPCHADDPKQPGMRANHPSTG